jgi:acyl transferase domain-containing protein
MKRQQIEYIARLDDLAIVQSDVASLRGTIRETTVCDAASQVLNRQHLKPSDIGFLEVSASGIASEDQPEMVGLAQAYGGKESPLICALGSSKAHIGHTYTAFGNCFAD